MIKEAGLDGLNQWPISLLLNTKITELFMKQIYLRTYVLIFIGKPSILKIHKHTIGQPQDSTGILKLLALPVTQSGEVPKGTPPY